MQTITRSNSTKKSKTRKPGMRFIKKSFCVFQMTGPYDLQGLDRSKSNMFSSWLFIFKATNNYLSFAYIYNKTSMTRIPMARLSWLIRTRFEPRDRSSDSSHKQTFRNSSEKFSYLTMKMYVECVHYNRLFEVILMYTLHIPLFYSRLHSRP